jgi:hypothetical protein
VVVVEHSLPDSQVAGQTGPVSCGLTVVGVVECLWWLQAGVPFDTMHVAGECAGLHSLMEISRIRVHELETEGFRIRKSIKVFASGRA